MGPNPTSVACARRVVAPTTHSSTLGTGTPARSASPASRSVNPHVAQGPDGIQQRDDDGREIGQEDRGHGEHGPTDDPPPGRPQRKRHGHDDTRTHDNDTAQRNPLEMGGHPSDSADARQRVSSFQDEALEETQRQQQPLEHRPHARGVGGRHARVPPRRWQSKHGDHLDHRVPDLCRGSRRQQQHQRRTAARRREQAGPPSEPVITGGLAFVHTRVATRDDSP